MDFLNRFIVASLVCLILALFGSTLSTALPIKVVGPEYQSVIKTKNYGPVTPQDTLWSIALASRSDPNLAINQVMIAIFNANPTAFNNGDISSIKSGVFLVIPPANEISLISEEAASLQLAQIKAVTTKASNSLLAEHVTPPSTDVAEQANLSLNENFNDFIENQQASVDVMTPQIAAAISDITFLNTDNEILTEQLDALAKKLELMQQQDSLDSQIHSELSKVKQELAAIVMAQDEKHQSLLNNGWLIATLVSLCVSALLGGLFYVLWKQYQSDDNDVINDSVAPKIDIEEEIIPDLTLAEESLPELVTASGTDELLVPSDNDIPPSSSDNESTATAAQVTELPEPEDLDVFLEEPDTLAQVEEQPNDDTEVTAEPPGILAQDELEALLQQADALDEDKN